MVVILGVVFGGLGRKGFSKLNYTVRSDLSRFSTRGRAGRKNNDLSGI